MDGQTVKVVPMENMFSDHKRERTNGDNHKHIYSYIPTDQQDKEVLYGESSFNNQPSILNRS